MTETRKVFTLKIIDPIKHLVTDGRRHLICLPYSVQNLHYMGAQLSLGKHWYHASRGHYDIPVTRRNELEKLCLKVPPKTIARVILNHKINPLLKKSRKWNYGVYDTEQKRFVMFSSRGFTRIHYCPDWDYLCIHDDTPEFDACRCDI